MANEDHLAILRQGDKIWSEWRRENLYTQPYLRFADLRGANLFRINLHGADLYGADLQGAYLYSTDLSRADLSGADLSGADLTRVRFNDANLSSTNLQDAILITTVLERANLTKANLSRANFFGAYLSKANLHKAILVETNMRKARIGETLFIGVDLQTIQDLDTLYHSGPSYISIDTLYRSKGQIPEIFLRGCGVPDSMIEYARSLVAAERPIDYYSVFISYASTDQACAERLHADLQNKGVRCWFAPHDLEIGVPIVRGIDEAIRIYDKLLIILSKASVRSHWVEFEVSQALHREVEQGRTMLFPIRLDDTVLHTPSGWAAQLRSRNIGDFQGWKDHDVYQIAFTRLLRDLKAKD